MRRVGDQEREVRPVGRPHVRLPGAPALNDPRAVADLAPGEAVPAEALLAALEAAFARAGLFVVRPLSQATLDRVGAPLRLTDLLPGARAGVVIGDGGGSFFAGFRAAGADDGGPDPLDRYTRQVIPAVIEGLQGSAALGSEAVVVRYPFDDVPPILPMQRLGLAAGLPAPGPLGVQIHPRFGPWWAYRALLVLRAPLREPAALASPCAGCPAPCRPICPGSAVTAAGLEIDRCARHRLADAGQACQLTCVARSACVVGPEHHYPAAQLTHHMSASLRSLRKYYGGRS